MKRLSIFYCLRNCLAVSILSIQANTASGAPYIYTEDSNIPTEQFQYLEDMDEKTSLSDLQKANWKGKIESIHSYYNGLWVKLAVLNQTDKSDLGVRHWTTFGKNYLLLIQKVSRNMIF